MRERPPTDPVLGVIPADPGLRRVAFAAWLVLGALGAAAIWYVSGVLDHARALAMHDARAAFMEIQRVTVPIVVVSTIIGVGFAVYLLVIAMRVLRTGRFPLPGARVMAPTPVRTGRAAQRLAIVLAAFAVVLLGSSLAVPVFVRRVMQAVERQRVEPVRAVPPSF
jgi:hypothetical protein